MPYLPSIALLAFGLVLLGVLMVRLVVGLRRLNRTTTMVVANTKTNVGLLRARAAAVRVGIAQRTGAITNRPYAPRE